VPNREDSGGSNNQHNAEQRPWAAWNVRLWKTRTSGAKLHRNNTMQTVTQSFESLFIEMLISKKNHKWKKIWEFSGLQRSWTKEDQQ
jgi:hypothetical protein